MTYRAPLLAGVLVAATLCAAGPGFSETPMPTTVTLTEVDPTVLATGYRASEILKADVYNDAGEKVGTLEDMIVTTSGTVPYAVVSVGGFLGMNAHHVVVAGSALQLMGKKLTLHGATKESLKALPNFTFGS
ncbi:PRC-barrel domain containing protein [Rhodobacter capsulatus]|uniref:PRC-barrel domain containing protein n=1 Tax=Rhodobacter capsulatus TaxID=1061 RepID=A0A4U1JPI9_RHOCA|nr:PRC-barrel domain-containing protein [Rhodobacter capsulatus]TKD15703.1 PRC-barrel domain containing protein [Rhodobacter capsulatus]